MSKLKLTLDDLLEVEALTENQAAFLNVYRKYDVHLLHGVAGTGKTFLALYKALEDVLDKRSPYKEVILLRSAVPARNVGFLPGSLEEKAAVYETPYVKMCKMLFDRGDAYTRLKEQKTLDFMLTSFMRGDTLDNAIIIVDEVQNLDYQELYTTVTRVGTPSKIVFCGDTRQTDLSSKKDLDKFMKVLDNMSCVHRVDFGIDDIVRGDIVKEFIIAENELMGGY